MEKLHRHILHHRRLAAWLVAATLLLRVLVPTGYMLDVAGGAVTVELCAGYGPMTMARPMPAMARHVGKHDGRTHDGDKAERPCAFAGLNAPALGGADPLLLAVALAFVMAAALRADVPPAPRRRRHLRPPLRGPPLPC